MKERIKKIIEYENISNNKFADITGIQRSGLSHLINGRNKPSLDVIQKILETFDYINTDWLLFGKGSMIKEEKKERQAVLFPEHIDNKVIEESKENNSKSEENLTDNTAEKILFDSREDKNADKKIKKIVIFYSDKTFSDFSPEN